MEKFIRFAIFGAVFFASCNTRIDREFEVVGSRTEQASTVDSTKILLYACNKKNDQASIEKFCADQKKNFTGDKYQVLVFFDNRDNAVYPQLPDPGLYLPEEHFLKHIKAIYRYNYRLEKGKLDYYSNNMLEGRTMTVRL